MKGSFYEAINHQGEKTEDKLEARKMTRSLVKYEGMSKEEASHLDETLTVLEMFREDETQGNQTRKKRFFAELGSILAGVGAYVSLRLRMQNAVSPQPCVGKLGKSPLLLNFLVSTLQIII